MPDVLLNNPSPGGANKVMTDLAGWLSDLLDAARNREDAPLARLIADVMDDLGRATKD